MTEHKNFSYPTVHWFPFKLKSVKLLIHPRIVFSEVVFSNQISFSTMNDKIIQKKICSVSTLSRPFLALYVPVHFPKVQRKGPGKMESSRFCCGRTFGLQT